jgi:hypothetical protein
VFGGIDIAVGIALLFVGYSFSKMLKKIPDIVTDLRKKVCPMPQATEEQRDRGTKRQGGRGTEE